MMMELGDMTYRSAIFRFIPIGIYYCTVFAIFYPNTLSYQFQYYVLLLFLPLLEPCGALDCFLLSESVWKALILPVLVLDSTRTMHGSAEYFIHQEQLEN